MYHSGRHPLPPSQQHQYSPHQYQTRPPQQQGTCCQSRNPCSCPPPQEQPRYCICGRHGRRLMQRHEPHCPCEVRGQRHGHTPIWTADPDDCETNRIKRHIIRMYSHVSSINLSVSQSNHSYRVQNLQGARATEPQSDSIAIQLQAYPKGSLAH